MLKGKSFIFRKLTWNKLRNLWKLSRTFWPSRRSWRCCWSRPGKRSSCSQSPVPRVYSDPRSMSCWSPPETKCDFIQWLQPMLGLCGAAVLVWGRGACFLAQRLSLTVRPDQDFDPNVYTNCCTSTESYCVHRRSSDRPGGRNQASQV